jgi:hypothetical protein
MTFVIQKHYRGQDRAARQKAYKYLASLGIRAPKPKHPEDIFYMGVPADADTYDKYAAAIARRTEKIQDRLGALKTIPDLYERNFLAILSVNAIVFSFNHKLPQKTEGQLTDYLARLWGRSKLASLLKKIHELPPAYLGKFVVLSEIGTLDKEEFRKKEFKRNLQLGKRSGTAGGIAKIIEQATKEANTAGHLYRFLYEKADWQERKSHKTVSYDREINTTDEDGQPLRFSDVLGELNPRDVLDEIDRKTDIAKIMVLVEKLPPAEKTAVRKFYEGDQMTPTERKAKDRGIKKIRDWMGNKKP